MSKKLKNVFFIVLLVVLVFSLGSFANEQKGKIIFSFSGQEKEIMLEDLKQFAEFTINAPTIDSEGKEEIREATGVYLKGILASFNKNQKDFNLIRLIAKDGYQIDVPAEIIQNRELMLAYKLDGKELSEKSAPIRVVIPNERSMYWARQLARVELVEDQTVNKIKQVVFLDNAVNLVVQEDFPYYGETDKAVKTKDLVEHFVTDISGKIYFKAVDGFEKTEDLEIFNKGSIKFTGKNAPIFLSKELPKGMYVKDLLWFSCNDTVFFSGEKGFGLFEEKSCDDKTGFSIKALLNEIGVQINEKSTFYAADGYKVTLEADDIQKGLLYSRKKDGKLAICFEGLPKETSVKEVVSIHIGE